MARQKMTGYIEVDLETGAIFINGNRLMVEYVERQVIDIYQEYAREKDKIRQITV